jgi:hypothetical protein
MADLSARDPQSVDCRPVVPGLEAAARSGSAPGLSCCPRCQAPIAASRRLGIAPVFDAVVVRDEAVVDAPEDCLGAAGDVDLAIDRADVGLDRVRAEEGQRCYLGVAFALRYQGKDLRLAVVRPSPRPGGPRPDLLEGFR